MSYDAKVCRVLFASPRDLSRERAAFPEVIQAWNATHSANARVVLLPLLWEIDVVPEMGDRPQAIINRQIVDDCDILVGAFWRRLGTPTGIAESGTVEEIEEVIQSGKPVMLYFSSRPVAPDKIDVDQYTRLREFKKKIAKRGVTDRYESVTQFREKLMRHLSAAVTRVRSSSQLWELPQPDAVDRELQEVYEQFRTSILRHERDWVSERDLHFPTWTMPVS